MQCNGELTVTGVEGGGVGAGREEEDDGEDEAAGHDGQQPEPLRLQPRQRSPPTPLLLSSDSCAALHGSRRPRTGRVAWSTKLKNQASSDGGVTTQKAGCSSSGATRSKQELALQPFPSLYRYELALSLSPLLAANGGTDKEA